MDILEDELLGGEIVPPLTEEPFACIYLLSKCPCLVLAEELRGLTHVLVCGQQDNWYGQLGPTHGICQSSITSELQWRMPEWE